MSGKAFIRTKRTPVYSWAKAFISAWTVALRTQLAQTTTGVIEVAPPLVRTELTQGRHGGVFEPEVVCEAVVRGQKSKAINVVIGKAKILLALAKIAPALGRKLTVK